jgi:AcrR family transcriptional regulator
MQRNYKRGRVRRRKTLAERSAETRKLLLDTTIDCLVDKGYSGTTTTEIAHRAGLTRGAQIHHFENKEMLVGNAVEHLIEELTDQTKSALEEFLKSPGEKDPLRAIVDLNWTILNGRFFFAWLEFLVAARTDARLRKVVRRVSRRAAEVRESTRQHFGAEPREDFDLIQELAYCVMAGLEVANLVSDADERSQSEARILGILKETVVFLSTNPDILRKYTQKERAGTP